MKCCTLDKRSYTQARQRAAESKIIKDAEKLKAQLQAAHHAYSELLQEFQRDASWSWTEAGQRAKLAHASEALRSKLTPFLKDFLLSKDFCKDKKKNYSKERMQTELQEFLKSKSLVEDLQNLCSNTRLAHENIHK